MDLSSNEFHSNSWFALRPSQTNFSVHKPQPRPWVLIDEPSRPIVRAMPRTKRIRRESATTCPHSSHAALAGHPRTCWMRLDGTILVSEVRRLKARHMNAKTYMCPDPDARLSYDLRVRAKRLRA